jgi:hypothetical protein
VVVPVVSVADSADHLPARRLRAQVLRALAVLVPVRLRRVPVDLVLGRRPLVLHAPVRQALGRRPPHRLPVFRPWPDRRAAPPR